MQASDSRSSAQHILSALRSRIWLPLCLGLALAVTAWWLIPNQAPRYSAESYLQVVPDLPRPGIAFPEAAGRLGGSDPETLVWLLQGREVAERVARRLAQLGHRQFQPSPAGGLNRDPAGRFQEVMELEVERVSGTRIVVVRTTGEGATLVQQAAGIIADEAVNHSRERNQRAANEALPLLRGRIQETRDRLEDLIRSAEELKVSNRELLVLSESRPIAGNRNLARLSAELEALDRALRRLQRMVEDGFAGTSPWKPEAAGEPATARLEGEVAQLMENLQRRRSQQAERSLQSAQQAAPGRNSEIAKLEEQLADRAELLEARYRTRRLEIAAQRNALLPLSRNLESLPEVSRRLESLNHEIELKFHLLKLLSQRLEEALLYRSLPANDVAVVQKPAEARRIRRLSRVGGSLLALMLGFFLGTGLVLLLEKREAASGYRRRLERSFGLPVLGTVPEIPREQVLEAMPLPWRGSLNLSDLTEMSTLVVHFLPGSEWAQPFHRIAQRIAKGPRKNNFPEFAPGFGSDWADLKEQNRRRSRVYVEDFASEDQPKPARRRDAKMGSYSCAGPKGRNGRRTRSILISAAVAGEGATLVSVNLALTLARQGRRVLLVDANLRRPRLHRVFGVTRVPGLSDQILGVCEWQGAMQTLEHFSSGRMGKEISLLTPGLESLTLLPAGSRVERPGETVGRPGMQELLQEWGRHFDLVLLDAPPLAPVADTTSLAPLVDSIFIVHRIERSDMKLIASLKDRLEGLGARIGGFIVNSGESGGVTAAEKEHLLESYQPEEEFWPIPSPPAAESMPSVEEKELRTELRSFTRAPQPAPGRPSDKPPGNPQNHLREERWKEHLLELMNLTEEP